MTESPFSSIPARDLTIISASGPFQVLRRYLAEGDSNSFCSKHATQDGESRATWLLHRDLLHALIVPVTRLFQRASMLAYAALCCRNSEELELAFSGDGRGAFVWLQCLISEDEKWCKTIGCPACITIHSLSSESTVRAALAAALLSTVTPHGTGGQHSLPELSAVIPALEKALRSDPFWGPYGFSSIKPKADRLCQGIREMLSQCSALEALVCTPPSSPTTEAVLLSKDRHQKAPPAQIDSTKSHGSGRLHRHAAHSSSGIKLKHSGLAKRQLQLHKEVQEWSFHYARRKARVILYGPRLIRILSKRRLEVRKRSLTWS